MTVLSYHLRVQKEIERRLFLDILAFVDRRWPVRDAVYIGMGSVYFEDFKAIHDRFGTNQMISLEQEEWIHRRQAFNIPLSPSSIELLDQSASDFLNKHCFDKSKKHIVWFDFDTFMDVSEHLSTFSNLLSGLQEGDVAKITLNATHSRLENRASFAQGKWLNSNKFAFTNNI